MLFFSLFFQSILMLVEICLRIMSAQLHARNESPVSKIEKLCFKKKKKIIQAGDSRYREREGGVNNARKVRYVIL